jgi:hypothetical protein
VVNASLLQPPPICIVGVDSNNRNTIVWERPTTNLIDSFYVYRESTVANVYERIGGVAFNDFSVLTDPVANPAQRAWRYRLTAIDTCGMESPFSPIHKTMHLTINKGIANSWNLIWDGYQGFSFGSYAIYRGTDSTNMSLLTFIQSNLSSYTDLTPPGDTVYYQLEIINPLGCNPNKAINYNSSRSNQANTIAYIVPDTTGIPTLQQLGFAMDVYPNPNNGSFFIYLNSTKAAIIELMLYDALGQLVYAEQLPVSGKLTKNLQPAALPPGLYFLMASDGEGRMVKKVLVSKE